MKDLVVVRATPTLRDTHSVCMTFRVHIYATLLPGVPGEFCCSRCRPSSPTCMSCPSCFNLPQWFWP